MTSRKIAVFPGTFDPFTNGHLDIVKKGLKLFDEVIIAIGVNARKKRMFSLEKRIEWIENVFKAEPRVQIDTYEGLTTDYCQQKNAEFILRGLRTAFDFEYERQIALVNEDLNSSLQSVFIMSGQANSIVSSTIIRDLILHNGNYQQYIPSEVKVNEVPPE